MWYGFKPYVPIAERRRRAQHDLASFKRVGRGVAPVLISGRTIARTFWGQAWCRNLERYSDFSNRLPRGRTYVRNGSVVDLQIAPGQVKARVSGSMLYDVTVEVASLPKTRWSAICSECAGAIDSLVELLQGRFSKGVMERICEPTRGLFPEPKEIRFSCSCPDWASMCKHVAAVLYGVGARLDERPELIFALRKVDHGDLVAQAGSGLPLSRRGPARERILASDDLSELFGLDLGSSLEQPALGEKRPAAGSARGERKPKSRAADSVAVSGKVIAGRPKGGGASSRTKAGAKRIKRSPVKS